MLDPALPTLSRLLEWSAPSRPDRAAKQVRWGGLLALAGLGGGPVAGGGPCPGRPCSGGPWRIKVAGTNGKGSVAAMLEACLRSAGLATGLFTSPHLLRPTERLRIAGREVAAARLESCAQRLEPMLEAFAAGRGPEHLPSFFEILVLLSLVLFEEEGVEVAIYEAGLGGANDVVSRLPAPLSVLTSVGHDHREQLGSSLAAIARDKVGIAEAGSTLVVGPALPEEAQEAVEEEAARRGVTLLPAAAVGIEVVERRLDGTRVHLEDHPGLGSLRLPLVGGFQLANLACAVAAVEALVAGGRLTSAACLAGLARTDWPGRCEHLPGSPAWLLDGAHNGAALAELAAVVEEHFAASPRLLLFGTTRGGEWMEWGPLLERLGGEVCLVEGFFHAVPCGELARGLDGRLPVRRSFAAPEEAVAELTAAPWAAGRVVVVAGSLYLVGRVRRALVEPGSGTAAGSGG